MPSIQKAKDKVSAKAKRLSARLTAPMGLASSPTPPPDGPPGTPPPCIAADGTDLSIPDSLRRGTEMTKVSEKKQKRVVFRLDADEGHILYKSRKSGVVPIEAIKEIRTGANTSYYRSQFSVPEEWESRWITIIYIVDGTYKTLHMVANTRDVFKLWEVSLRKLHSIRQGLMTGLGNVDLRQTVWERQYWRGADEEGDHKLDFDDVERLCKRLNVNLTRPKLQRMFQDADSSKRGYLDFPGFQKFVKALKYRPELNAIYAKVGTGAKGGKFNFVAFKKFMTVSQKTSLPDDELKSIFVKYTHATNFSDDLVMSLDHFSSFLLSPDNSVFSERGTKIWQDMNLPLSDYYVSSSHNTYLVGHQLVGVSTIEGYIRALLHSCRSVELDIYDGDDEPMIYHGKTFTSKVSLRDICHAIAKYAFVASPYPLLISAEIHCGIKQQEKLVDIMSQVFGEKLVQAPVENRPKLEKLPSPEELKFKILLKAKNQYITARLAEIKAQRELEQAQKEGKRPALTSILTFTSSSESSSSDREGEEGGNNGGGLRRELKSKWRKLRGKSPSSVTTSSQPSLATGATNPSSSNEDHKQKMSLRLVSLLVYTVGVKCHGVGRQAGVEYEPEHIFSLSENAINRLMKAPGVLKELIKHTQKNLVRIYPKGTRVSSTNYEPHRYWAAGAQVVAINWQTFDLGYTINQAMFQRNGRCGYVLKPLALRAEGEELLNKSTRHFFDVTIISAQQIPRPRDSSGQEIIEDSIIDPFVEVTLHIPDWTTSPFLPVSQTYKYKPETDAANLTSSTSTARRVSLRTHVIKNNGFNPVWQESLSIPFDRVGGPEGGMQNLIFVEFAVRQEKGGDDDDPIAVYCAPLGTVELGYRHLPLYDMQLTQHMFSTLFIQTAIRDAN